MTCEGLQFRFGRSCSRLARKTRWVSDLQPPCLLRNTRRWICARCMRKRICTIWLEEFHYNRLRVAGTDTKVHSSTTTLNGLYDSKGDNSRVNTYKASMILYMTSGEGGAEVRADNGLTSSSISGTRLGGGANSCSSSSLLASPSSSLVSLFLVSKGVMEG